MKKKLYAKNIDDDKDEFLGNVNEDIDDVVNAITMFLSKKLWWLTQEYIDNEEHFFAKLNIRNCAVALLHKGKSAFLWDFVFYFEEKK